MRANELSKDDKTPTGLGLPSLTVLAPWSSNHKSYQLRTIAMNVTSKYMEEVSSEAGCTGEAPPTLESQKQAVLAILVGSLAMGKKEW